MHQTQFTIQHIEEKNDFFALCFFEEQTYEKIDPQAEWIPLKRLLVNSDQQQIIYMMDVEGEWVHICFPLHLWRKLDRVMMKDQDLMLVLSKTEAGEAHRTVPFKNFRQECLELVGNMRDNANYGEIIVEMVEEVFPETLRTLDQN